MIVAAVSLMATVNSSVEKVFEHSAMVISHDQSFDGDHLQFLQVSVGTLSLSQ